MGVICEICSLQLSSCKVACSIWEAEGKPEDLASSPKSVNHAVTWSTLFSMSKAEWKDHSEYTK